MAMSRRSVALLVLAVVVGLTMVPAAQAASVSSASADDVEVMAGETGETTVTVWTSGTEEEQDVDATISVDDGGQPFDVEETTVTIPPGDSESVDLDVDVDDDADPGTYTVYGDANGVSFDFTVTVEAQPPTPDFEDDPLDAGDLLVGETASGELVIEEVGGDTGLEGVEWRIVDDDPDATLELNDMDGSGWGEGSVQTGPGGEDTAEWQITVDEDVDQHESLSWTVELEDARYEYDETREVDVEARVIYPGYFGELEFDDPMVFDEPRDETDEITETIELEVPNDGDQPLDVSSVSASASSWDISVDTQSVPDEIDARSTETVDVVVTASTGLSEGDYDFSATASASDYSVESGSYDGDLEIVHDTRIAVESVSLGDVPIGEGERVTATVEEELGYNDIYDLEMTLEEGPDDWLTVQSAPGGLLAGESDTVRFALEFDTDAELGTNYEWTYEFDSEDAESERMTIVAAPVPLDLDPIRDDLSGHDGPVADGTLEMVETMDSQMRAGEADGDDVSTILTFGSASTLYLDASEEATDLLDDGQYDEAQAEIVQASAAYNTMTLYAERLEGDELRADSDEVLATAENDLAGLIDEQEAYYEQQLESGDLSLLEEATIQRNLARVVLLQGDEERAAELESDAEAAFEDYSEAVATGESAAQEADEVWESMESEQFVTVLGQPLLLNPAEYDTVTDRTAALHESYDESVAAFEDAGESSRAEAVATEHETRASALETARLSLFLAIGVYGLVAAAIVTRTARRMYWYLQDARESVTGDFLV
ncbi:NPCBM-associated, NEW3 domain of alpha-galactosidase [Halobiforma haloterrestris]|uniref:NPCBM-associated, NEW3 domain of alpha-galactosidase n=2 Tax=Natronobacterium haloterrestre TaxID=148448 RepID=A0A1I1GU79_NATHA|nr:NPCBM-associated, NEW3 domain of alpha-galactosidase [Halobiforma haloterrestris]